MLHCDITEIVTKSDADDQPLSVVAAEILLTLARGPRHGYGIKLDVEKRIGDGKIVGSGSLYQSLQRLERRGYIAEVETAHEDSRRGRVYRIEDAGLQALSAELARMERTLQYARAHALAPGGG